jgi:hypothetical protein
MLDEYTYDVYEEVRGVLLNDWAIRAYWSGPYVFVDGEPTYDRHTYHVMSYERIQDAWKTAVRLNQRAKGTGVSYTIERRVYPWHSARALALEEPCEL